MSDPEDEGQRLIREREERAAAKAAEEEAKAAEEAAAAAAAEAARLEAIDNANRAQDVCQACLDGDLERIKSITEGRYNEAELLRATSLVRLDPKIDPSTGEFRSVPDRAETHELGGLFTPGFDVYTMETYTVRTLASARAAKIEGPCKTASSLQYAAYTGNEEVVRYLVEQKGVEKTLVGDFKATARSIAYCRRNNAALVLLQ